MISIKGALTGETDMYQVCNWGFIVNDYVPIKRLGIFDSFEAAQKALAGEWKRREIVGQYTDMGTFSIRPISP